MRIVIESGSHAMHNWGDMSMLAVALERLHALAPDAELHVLTRSPERVSALDPHVVPVLTGRPTGGYGGGRGLAARAKEWARRVVPHEALRATAQVVRRSRPRRDAVDVHDLVASADLLVASGGGYLTDVFHDKLLSTLDLLETAQAAGVPTALMGQGLGPFEAGSWARAKEVLRRTAYLSLRDRRQSADLARGAGVAVDRLTVSGDDAIESAARHAPHEVGSGIGINLRTTTYSRLGGSVEAALGAAVAKAMRARGATPRPLPIAAASTYSDVESIRRVLRHAGHDSDGGADIGALDDLFDAVARCRVVVTGSYHAGVFALSQGIPVVAVSGSDYYDGKFLGLADVFDVENACVVLRSTEPTFERDVSRAVLAAWDRSEELRGPLRASATAQADASRNAYRAMMDRAPLR